MAKNITIAEGGVSRNFTAKKLKTNLQGGGNCTWVPEDEAADYCTFKELTARQNGTYKAEDSNCDGFSKVKVEVASDVLPQKTITVNGEYDAYDDDGKAGYAHVTVNVPGGGGGPFTVLFLDDEGNVLKKQENVPYGGYASCTALDGTIRNGLYFKGWNPVPKNVQFNLTCQPVRGDYQIIPGEILDDWETIVADGGAHYPLGSYKTLVCTVPAQQNFSHVITGQYTRGSFADDLAYGYSDSNVFPTINAVNIACHMVKVAEGEDGSTSSWVSDGFIDLYQTNLSIDKYRRISTMVEYNMLTDWLNSPVRKWMNNNLYSALPLPLQNAIVGVNKTTKAFDVSPSGTWVRATTDQMLDKTSIDEIWMPSMKEWHNYISQLEPRYSEYFIPMEELSGIDYSTVFVPTISSINCLSFRTLGGAESYQPYYVCIENGTYLDTRGQRYTQFGFCL